MFTQKISYLLYFIWIKKSVIHPLTGTVIGGSTWIDAAAANKGPSLMPVLVNSEQVLHRTTSPFLQICKPALPLVTAESTTVQGALKESLQQGVMPTLGQPDQLTPFDL